MFYFETVDGSPLPPEFAYASYRSAGIDLPAAHGATLAVGERRLIHTNIRIKVDAQGTDEIEGVPADFIPELQVRSRSGLALKEGVVVLNAPGTIDADYRGEIGVILINLGDKMVTIEKGQRIAQLVPALVARAWNVETKMVERGAGGFGSTGK
jgi:dUTP pyrophosphatase